MKKLPLIIFWISRDPSPDEEKRIREYINNIRARNDVKIVMTSREKKAKEVGEKILFGRGFKVLETNWLDEIFGFENIASQRNKVTEYFDGRMFSDIEAQESVINRIEQINKLVNKAKGIDGSMVLVSHKGIMTMYLWKKLEAIVDPVEFYFSTSSVGGFILPEFPFLQNSNEF